MIENAGIDYKELYLQMQSAVVALSKTLEEIQKQIQYASVVICSNRPANNNGMSIEEIKYALSINKPVVAVSITCSTSVYISQLGIDVISCRKDSLENWICKHI